MPIEYKKLIDEVKRGLPNSSRRRDSARKNADFYSLEFDKYPVEHRDGTYQSDAVQWSTPFLRQVCDILCANLYKSDPQRQLSNPIATEFLATVYKRQRMAAKWKRAEALTFVGGYGGFQFAGGESIESPVVITQWQPHELTVWTDPDDATEIAAVATCEEYDGGARLKLWTPETLTTFERKKADDHSAFSSRDWQQTSKKDNPYRRIVVKDERTGEEEEGIVPFTFYHWNFPCSFFDTSSPGDVVCVFNENLNRRLAILGDAIEYQSYPIGWGKNLPPNFKFPTKVKPGIFLDLVNDADVSGNMAGDVDLGYLAPPLEHIRVNWEELNVEIDHMLEMLGIPKSAFRMDQSATVSGIALQSEQLPLLTRAEGRRSDWQSYEEDAARMAIMIAESHTRANGVVSEADRLKNVLDDWQFSLQWPTLYAQLPGPQRDQSNQTKIDQGVLNKVTMLMNDNGWTEQESLDYLQRLAEQDAKLMAMGIEAKPTPPPVNGYNQTPQLFDAQGNPVQQQQQPQPNGFGNGKPNPFKDSF